MRRMSPITICGSAPRARGKLALRDLVSRHVWFSPTSAGNTGSIRTRWSSTTVQPRSRGEHSGKRAWHFASYGSAPRAQGTPNGWELQRPSERFRPAGAGNTKSFSVSGPGCSVQPRERGEHVAQKAGFQIGDDSAPHAWGTLRPPILHPGRHRFSPECGEHLPNGNASKELVGSAPRVRGTRPERPMDRAQRWFSPASAGNTIPACRRWTTATVQPHEYGEHSSCKLLISRTLEDVKEHTGVSCPLLRDGPRVRLLMPYGCARISPALG